MLDVQIKLYYQEFRKQNSCGEIVKFVRLLYALCKLFKFPNSAKNNLALHANISNFWEGGGYFPLKYTPLYCYEAHLHLIWILSTNILRFQDRGRRGELQ